MEISHGEWSIFSRIWRNVLLPRRVGDGSITNKREICYVMNFIWLANWKSNKAGFELVPPRFYLLPATTCIPNCDRRFLHGKEKCYKICLATNVLLRSSIFLCVTRLTRRYGGKLLEDKIAMRWSLLKPPKLALCKAFTDNWMNALASVSLISATKEKMSDGEEYSRHARLGCNVPVTFRVFVPLIMTNIRSTRIVRTHNLAGICLHIITTNWEAEKYINDIVRSTWFKFF